MRLTCDERLVDERRRAKAMTKLDEKITERQQTRTRLLELRRTYADRNTAHEVMLLALKEDAAAVKRVERQLVALTTEVEQLLHADLAGIIPRNDRVPADAAASVDAAPPAEVATAPA
jgi:hypothetical protein